MKKKYRIASKFRFYTFIIVTILILTGTVTAVFGESPAHPNELSDCVEVVVESGDTLWNIARAYGPTDVDIRVIVWNIERLNDVTAAELQPGQVLLVPTVL